jgi:hypothetical protein
MKFAAYALLPILCAVGLAANSQVVINEIHHSPDPKQERVEFVELYNRGTNAVDLGNWKLSGGVKFTIPTNTVMAVGGYLVLAEDPAALKAKYGTAGALGPWEGSLNGDGEKLTLRDAGGNRVNEVDYQLGFPWPIVGSAPGPSIELINPDLDNSLGGNWRASASGSAPSQVGPTPGQRNRAFALNAPPSLRQVSHSPTQPTPGTAVTVSARVTDPDGVAAVALDYQVVTPGKYIELTDPEYATNWTRLSMTPTLEDTNVFSVTLPRFLSQHRNLIRYRVIAQDALGAEVTAPYPDDPSPNFAVFCYNGVHSWTGAIQPGAAGALGQQFSVSREEMNRLPVFLLISKSNSVAVATGWAPGQPYNQYRGSEYLWKGTLVYDGEVYDHIRYRARGGVWRYSMGKNAWKFDFNRAHNLKMKDNFGSRFHAIWDKLSLRPDIQQGDFDHRGEQGLFESVGYRLFQLAGVDANNWAHMQFRIVDEAAEDKQGDQFGSDFWGLYLGVEEQDGQFLKERGLPDGNIFKMANGGGVLNHTGKLGPLDYSDLYTFLNTYNSTVPAETWWRTNLNLARYFGYQTVVQAIHHYDIADGKNYFYYRNPASGLWEVQPWDLDLTWADNMYRAGTSGGDEPFKSRVLANFSLSAPTYPNLSREFRNRVRELRDLLINADQAGAVIDEQARLIHGTNTLSITDADRAQWDYNPVMTNSAITLASKAGWGRFYKYPLESGVPKTFFGAAQLMKNYLARRATILDNMAKEPDRPATPALTYTGPASYPVNRMSFHASGYSGAAGFGSVKWRIAEISRPDHPSFNPNEPMRFEVQSTWETAELTNAVADLTFPAAALRPGKLYRARVRYTDTAGRTSNWSPPVEFTAGESDLAAGLVESLRFTELMYNPPPEGFEFIELFNASSVNTLDLSGAKFTAGVDFTFPTNSLLQPGGYALVLKTTNFLAFRTYYGLPESLPLFGPYNGSLDNGGETVTLKTSAGGTVLFSFTYSNLAPWPTEADGTGYSLVPAENGPADLNDARHWRASLSYGGSPNRADPATPSFAIGGIVTGKNGLQLNLTVPPSVNYTIEVSGDLVHWTPVSTNTGPSTFQLPFTPGAAGQFVRAVRQ